MHCAADRGEMAIAETSCRCCAEVFLVRPLSFRAAAEQPRDPESLAARSPQILSMGEKQRHPAMPGRAGLWHSQQRFLEWGKPQLQPASYTPESHPIRIGTTSISV